MKAIGNCYVAPPDASLSEELRPFVTMAEDSGESAYIFPASSLSEEEVEEYLGDTSGSRVPVLLHRRLCFRLQTGGDGFF